MRFSHHLPRTSALRASLAPISQSPGAISRHRSFSAILKRRRNVFHREIALKFVEGICCSFHAMFHDPD